MFGIGGLEFLVIAIVTVLVVGPDELPRVLYNVGKAIGKIREFSKSFSDGIEQISREGELQDIIENANEAGDDEMNFRIAQQRALEERQAREKNSKAKKTVKQTGPKKKTSSAKKNKTEETKTEKTGGAP